jgi:hypothetical protein
MGMENYLLLLQIHSTIEDIHRYDMCCSRPVRRRRRFDEDELILDEEERPEGSEPITAEEILQLRIAGQ